jgi:recombination protein RecR
MDELQQLTDALSLLPGIGRRSAARLAMHLARHPDDVAAPLAAALDAARRNLAVCSLCGNVTPRATNPCHLCSDPRRDASLLCVVEDPGDIPLVERSGEYRGRYFALMGRLSPMRGDGLGSLRLPLLLDRAKDVKEVILALDGNVESEATASYIRHALAARHPDLRISRLALGIPAGSALSYSDPVTLAGAIRGRTTL